MSEYNPLFLILSYDFEMMQKIILFLFLYSSAIAQSKKPITHEDLWMLKRVSFPAISPNGEWCVYNVSEPNYDEKEQIHELYISATKGTSKPRKITSSKGSESSYSWSPDGKKIAFAAKRNEDEKAQVYILNIAEGGEAQRLTSLCTGASNPKWSPDGKKILFSSSVYALCFADSCNKKKIDEEKKIKYKAKVYESFPIRNWDTWIEERQQHFFVQDVESKADPKNIYAEVKSEAKDLFVDSKIASNGDFSTSIAEWSNNSDEIYFIASTNTKQAAYSDVRSHLYKISIQGGEEKLVLGGDYSYSNPKFSEDGKYLFIQRAIENNRQVYNEMALIKYALPSLKEEANYKQLMDRPIQSYKVANDKLYLIIENQGKDELHSLDFKNDQFTKLSSNTIKGCITNVSVSQGKNPIIVANYESSTRPTEIVKITENGALNFLSFFNYARLDSLDLQEPETFWTTTKTGKKVRSMLIKPAGFDKSKKYPMIVLMHGGPAGSWKENWGYRWNYHLLAKPGYVILLTDYTGSTGYGEKFSQEIIQDPFQGPANEILDAAEDAIKQYTFIDPLRQAAAGASYGGHLTNWMQATTTHYKCLISHAGLVNSISQWGTSDVIYGREIMNGSEPWAESKVWKEQNPFTYSAQFKTPMLITIGELDYRVPINNSIENFYIHQRLKIPSKLIVFPEENHWISKAENSRFFYQEVHAWLAKWL